MLLAAAVLARGADASAATFCVGDAGCPAGAVMATLDAAAAATGALPGRDTVLVGPGTWAGAAFEAGNPVELVGAGRTATTLTAPAGAATLTLADRQSTVRGLGILVADSAGAVGLRLAGVASDVAVGSPDGAAAPASGVVLLDGAAVRDATIGAPAAAGAWAADVVPGGDAQLDQVRTGGAGVRVRGGRLTVSRSRIDARTGPSVLAAEGGSVRLDSTLVRALPGAEGGLRAHQPASSAVEAAIRARHVTLIGPGQDGSPALSATASGAGAGALIRVDDSIVRGFAVDRHARAVAGADAFVDVAYSNFDPAHDEIVGAGRLSPFGEDNRTYGAIRFVDSAGGDYRLRGVSPVIDRGTPGALLAGEPPLDLDGLTRIVDGNGVAGATRDMGAYEYQRRPPVLTAAAFPSLAQVGTPMRFEAQTSDPDPGDEVAVRWLFDDGTIVDGLAVDHAFASPGAHSALVTATDSGGASTTRTVLVRTTPPVAPVAAAQTATPPDVVAPRLALPDARLRLSRTGRVAIRVRCDAGEPEACRGTVSLTVRRTVKGSKTRTRWVAIAKASFVVPAGAQRTVRPRLRTLGRRLLRRTGRLRVRVTAVAQDTAGNRRVERRTITLRRTGNAKRGPSR